MGLFDSKKIKEEKDWYQKLTEIKGNSYELKNLLPASLKEFLKFPNKDRLIIIYKYTQEIIKRTDITQACNLENMGQCYDFIASYYTSYTIKQERAQLRNQLFESDFMSFLENSISNMLLEYKTKQEIDKNEREIETLTADIEGRLQTAYKSPTQQKLDEIVFQEADKLAINWSQDKFDKKFPQYKEIKHAVLLFKLGIGDDNPKVIAIKKYIDYGKEKFGIINLEFDDFLVPYLDEKFKSGILTEEEEKIYYKNTTDNKEIELKKRLFCLKVNALIFYRTEKEQNDFMESFEESNKINNDLYRQTKGIKR